MFDPLKTKSKVFLYVTVAFLFGLGLASGLGWTGQSLAMPVLNDDPPVAEEDVRTAIEVSDAFVAVSEAVTPAVVRIEVQRPARTARGQGQVPESFRRFFDFPEPEQRQPQPRIAGGSGFIVSSDGFILTNDHVVKDAERITVYLRDRREYRAEVVGSDPFTDVAVIKIDEGNLPTLSLGDSDEVRVGEWVLAVGNPGYGGARQLDYTVTSGIVSFKGRPLQLLGRELQQHLDDPDLAGYAIEDFIQTDAVINPGNSGGPMVNLRGQVVGINSAIASQTGFFEGYGFAIPVNLAKRVMEDLIEYGHVRRAWLGVQIEDIDPVDAEFYGLPEVRGVLVQSLPEGSPAANAGIQPEDIVVEVNGEPVERVGDLQQKIAAQRPGDRVTLTLYRDGEPREVEVRLGEAPISRTPEPAPEPVDRTAEKLGIEVQELTQEIARSLGYESVGGAVISDVTPGGPAQRRGVAPGWKIVEINRQPVEGPQDVQRALEGVDSGQIVSLLLENPDGQTRVVNVRIPR